jgi:hypothetical protein
MKIAVYLSAVPSKAKMEQKREYLMTFAHGAKAAGDEVWVVDEQTVIDADVAVLQGWIGMKSAPHLRVRQAVIKAQSRAGKRVLVMDSNLYGFLMPNDRDRFLRYSLDGIFPTTGYYFNRDVDAARWEHIKKSYGFQERPWRLNGRNILICLQRDGGWSMDGFGVMEWLDSILPQIRANSDRPILLRAHPGNQQIIPELQKRWPDIEISQSPDIRADFDRAWATITYNSSPSVASMLWGIPAWVTDPVPQRSQSWPDANTDLSMLENPVMGDRNTFYHRLAQCHFDWNEVRDGTAWRFMRARLP